MSSEIYVLSDLKNERITEFFEKELRKLIVDLNNGDKLNPIDLENTKLNASSINLLGNVIPSLDHVLNNSAVEEIRPIVLRLIAYLMVDVYFKEFKSLDDNLLQKIHADLKEHCDVLVSAKIHHLESLKK